MNVAVVGGGAAGCMAAYAAALNGAKVVLFERNEKIGKKIYITGKGRCNFTNAGENFLDHVVHNPKFLFTALRAFSPEDTMDFFKRANVPYKVERGGRVFPVSDKSSDIITALIEQLHACGAELRLCEEVREIRSENGRIGGVVTREGFFSFDRVVVATGGISYPSTGSTGDGYGWAKKAGHRIVPLRGSLVGFKFYESPACTGLSLKNVRASVCRDDDLLASEFGEMLFTDDGVSGPIVLTLSARLSDQNLNDCTFCIDLKPSLTREQLDERLRREFSKYANKDYANSLNDLLPKSMIPVVIERSGIEPSKKVHQITSKERAALLAIVKRLCYAIKGTDDPTRAIVTAGGVDVREVNPSTMESKIVQGLYFAGEILDLDALTGGYNLQIAFSTGYLAGRKCVETKE